MSAAVALSQAQDNGVRIEVQGNDLILEAEKHPPAELVEMIRRHKLDIVAILRSEGDEWTAEDWRVHFDERAAVSEHDGEQTRQDAETIAYECCLVEWLRQHPATSDPGACAWCGEQERDGRAVVPFGGEGHGHCWLHPECWHEWNARRRKEAVLDLADLGILAPSAEANGTHG